MADKNLQVFPLFDQAGVLTRDDDPAFHQAVSGVYSTPDNLVVGMPGVSPVNFPSTNITVNGTTGRLGFISSDTPYRVRELREDDGEWLSRYKTLLPLEALEALVGPMETGEDVDNEDNSGAPSESLDAYSLDDSVYIVGLVYTNTAGRWTRIDGDWVLMSPTDDTFDDMVVTTIEPSKADQFIQLYDNNFVTVQDAEQYEDSSSDDAPSEGETDLTNE